MNLIILLSSFLSLSNYCEELASLKECRKKEARVSKVPRSTEILRIGVQKVRRVSMRREIKTLLRLQNRPLTSIWDHQGPLYFLKTCLRSLEHFCLLSHWLKPFLFPLLNPLLASGLSPFFASLFVCNQWKTMETVRDFFWGAPKSLQMGTAAMKLKDTCSLEEKLWTT